MAACLKALVFTLILLGVGAVQPLANFKSNGHVVITRARTPIVGKLQPITVNAYGQLDLSALDDSDVEKIASGCSQCWEASPRLGGLTCAARYYEDAGYTCVAGSCAVCDSPGNDKHCATMMPAGTSPSLSTGTCEVTPPAAATRSCGVDCVECQEATSTCLRCGQNTYLSMQDGYCLPDCPPGFISVGTGEEGRTCEVCDGQSTRRRATASDEDRSACAPCDDGHISSFGKDDCHNIQETCGSDECQTCAACLAETRPWVQECVERKQLPAQCWSPGSIWCHKVQRKLSTCESMSMGCFYKLICHSHCICPEWKKVNCGGDSSGDAAKCAQEGGGGGLLQIGSEKGVPSAMMQRAQRISENDSETAGGDAALDESLAGKCL